MNEKIKKAIVMIILLILSIGICLQCGTSPFDTTHKALATDTSVFIYIGKAMQNGLLPYKDVFDHKGPFLYVINYLGLLIGNGNFFGIWFIEIISMFITLLFMYKTAKLFIKSDIISILAVIITNLHIITCLYGGNFAEEYAFPFIAISLYFMIKYLAKTHEITKIESVIMGACLGFVLLLKPNLITVWIVYCIIIFIDMLRNKKYKEAGRTVAYFLIGTFSVILVCVLILWIKGILIDCFNQYILFNFEYTAFAKNNIIDGIKYILDYAKLSIVAICICLVNLFYNLYKKKDIMLQLSSLLYIIVTDLVVLQPGRYYEHYALILIPTVLVPILLLFQFIENHKGKAKIILMCFVIAGLLFVCKKDIKNIKRSYIYMWKAGLSIDNDFVELIKQETTPEDKILVLGNHCKLYLLSDRQAASKYIYQPTLIEVDNKIREEVKYDIKNSNAKFIININLANKPENADINEILEELEKDKKYMTVAEGQGVLMLERNDGTNE